MKVVATMPVAACWTPLAVVMLIEVADRVGSKSRDTPTFDDDADAVGPAERGRDVQRTMETSGS